MAPEAGGELRPVGFSMTKTLSAHLRSSGVHGFSASGLSPAKAMSRSGRSAKTCSAVGYVDGCGCTGKGRGAFRSPSIPSPAVG
jgi:hypothetical protein